MRTRNLLMVAAALAMAGCSQNEVTEMSPDTNRAMTFDVYAGVQTRGAEMDLDALKTSGFGFLAYKTTNAGWDSEGSAATPSFLYNEKGTWDGSWGYTDTRFWPTNDDKITFFAYAPYESSPADGSTKGITLSASTQADAPFFDFAVKTTWADMIDLVTAKKVDQTSTTASGTVTFKFSHVLTKVADVVVKPDVSLGSDTKLFVTGLKLDPGSNKLQNKAKYQFSDDSWVAATGGASHFSGSQDLSGFINKNNSVDQWGYTTSSVDVSATGGTSLFPAGKALYFIPVANATGTSGAGDLKLLISYDLVTKTSASTHTFSTVTDKEVSLPAGTFKKGTAHTYTLTIKMNAINIAVDESFTAWETVGAENINVQ